MKPQANDTPLDVGDVLISRYRLMSPQQKLQCVCNLNRAVRELAAGGIRARHGAQISNTELRLRIAALLFNRATMVEVFGWDPDIEGY